MRRDTAKSGDGDNTKMPWHDYPSFSNRDETRGKTESPNSGQAHRPSSTQRGMIDTLRKEEMRR
jgi:hypothetical protein